MAEEQLRELIAHEAQLDALRQWFRRQGGVTLADSAMRLAEKEVTSLDEVMRVAAFD